MGRALITDMTLARYCAQPTEAPLTVRQRQRLADAIETAETACARMPIVREDYPRILNARIVQPWNQPSVDPALDEMAVIRQPRYAASNREAPKRSTLFTRLWSMLR